MSNGFDVLKERGFVYQATDENTIRELLKGNVTLYAGFDPSSDSLQLGNLLPVMALHHMQQAGARVIFLVGGGTGLVGDPTGKQSSRVQLSPKTVAANADSLKRQIEQMGLLSFSGRNKALLVNNYDWLCKISFLNDFLLGIAPHFSVNEMIKMQTFAQRLEEEKGLSLLEFLYPILQAYDFLHLFRELNCRLQVGGSDQWGNILQGIDLIKRICKKTAYGLTFPLLTTASGEKMGKSVGGAIWLSSKKTPPYELFQYLQKLDDSLVKKLLALYTLLPMSEVRKIFGNPREGQLRLAYEVTKLVHGETAASEALETTKKIRDSQVSPESSIPEILLLDEGELDEILVSRGYVKSKSAFRNLCAQGAVRLESTGEKVSNPKLLVRNPCVIRFGKGKYVSILIKQNIEQTEIGECNQRRKNDYREP